MTNFGLTRLRWLLPIALIVHSGVSYADLANEEIAQRACERELFGQALSVIQRWQLASSSQTQLDQCVAGILWISQSKKADTEYFASQHSDEVFRDQIPKEETATDAVISQPTISKEVSFPKTTTDASNSSSVRTVRGYQTTGSK